jgi:hypothetical protein
VQADLNSLLKINSQMKNKEKLLQQIFENQEKLIGKEWSESRQKAFLSIMEMKKRQNTLTKEEAQTEAFEQAEKIRKSRLERNGK